ncbi:3753_t:CDS:10 [Entrophospora sp. SA101]|nr:3753_t:CDS:10 [Entrophospora sp. SA101]
MEIVTITIEQLNHVYISSTIAALAWHSLADPNSTIRRDGVGTGQLHRQAFPKLVDKPFWNSPVYQDKTSNISTPKPYQNPSEQQIQGNSTPEWDQEKKNNKQVKGEEEEGNLFDKKKPEESSGWEQEREEQHPQRIHLDKKNEEEMGKLILIIHIEIENDNVQHINVHEYDDPIKLAKKFCGLWKVEPKVERALVQLIHDEKAKRPPPKYAHSQVELKISCKNLKDLDILSKSDPQIVLLVKDAKTQKWRPTPFKTEVVMNNLNPTFVTGIVVDYLFEELQEFRFICVDVDKPNDPDWEKQDFIGQFECDLGSIGGKMMGNLTSPKHPGEKRGLIIISAEEVSKSKRNLKSGGLFKPKPAIFLVVSRANEDNTFSPVYESDIVSSSNPFWQEFYIRESTLCNGDLDRALLLQVKQHRKSGGHTLLGECSVTLREILGGGKTFPLKLPSGSQGKISKDANITIIEALVEEPPSFLDYIAGGTEINLMVAIDFTGSNGDPRNQKSLHYSGGRGENDYQRAIRKAYDYDRLFPVYGFGAKFNGILSHAYPLNNNHQNPEVEGVEGILEVYSQTINTVELYGPTNFSPVYGVITDFDSTIRSIIKASSLPLSIVIVGVGNADFSHMNRLDADDTPLTSKVDGSNKTSSSKTIGRDIVQFVAMRDFQAEAATYLLPKAVLEEIPDQFMDYMNKNRIPPKSAKQRNIDELRVNPRFNITPDEPPPAYARDITS